MPEKAFQDLWPELYTHCFGCGRNNEHGLQIKSYWDGEDTICTWKPKKMYEAGMGILCGGILSTVIDCHCVNTAIAARYKLEGRELGSIPVITYVGGTITMKHISTIFIKDPIFLRAKINEITDRKTIMSCTVFSNDKECAKAEVTAVKTQMF